MTNKNPSLNIFQKFSLAGTVLPPVTLEDLSGLKTHEGHT